ncbi:SAM-dependent methyltransferase [Pandoraea pnomenusa]|uniref:Cyclopropane-fatty-acyl-phospholipid synthase n=1 Tax=Pandoraea pnomenusa TaxID=93220 RepID=A0A378YDN6_9BURK|nr:cyclopropane-fatty-acyl-phospholipid synthase family protein [Pandoraea pnomenusa]AIU25493.1 cyclopropane-fatty-acyl-phospholipid synthase [Pandoraea pnomenusa]SUA74621.1 Cyclopropane-fatty-acyl-phospholipid synthase [Pandoraea pnomenusa]
MTVSLTRPPSASADPTEESGLIRLCELGVVPDALLRAGMRQLMRQRLKQEHAHDVERGMSALADLVKELRSSPIAIASQEANAQHYEVPSEFFLAHLGPAMKYSCCYYECEATTLEQAEQAMLARYAERAQLADGQRILDLGCGWGSLALWLAERYPGSQIVGLSNSHGQRRFIEATAAKRGLRNLRIVTGNVADFDFSDDVPAQFDRVLSIEMFEHMKNYGALMKKIAHWLNDRGMLFVHIFAHRHLAYHFQDRDGSDWMSRHFFTGGTMPSADLLLHFQDDLRIVERWWVDGRHYARTANDWLEALDASRETTLPILEANYGTQARLQFQRWRMFYMAVAELFGYAGGQQWGVGHYLFEKRGANAGDVA